MVWQTIWMRNSIGLSDPATEALTRVLGNLLKAFENGVGIGNWKPTQSKTVEFLCWVYEQLCERKKLEIADVMRFVPITAPQGRRTFQPTLHQVSVATKMLRHSLGRDPNEGETMAFLKRNPDVGWTPTHGKLSAREQFGTKSIYQTTLDKLLADSGIPPEPNRSTDYEGWVKWLEAHNDQIVDHMKAAREYAESTLKSQNG